MRSDRIGVGRRGERAAARLLRARRYRILARNLRTRFGEIDLLVEPADRSAWVIVEVKAGQRGQLPPELHVDRRKQARLAALGAQLVRSRRLPPRPIRFDVVAVEFDGPGARRPAAVRHHAAAFESPW